MTHDPIRGEAAAEDESSAADDPAHHVLLDDVTDEVRADIDALVTAGEGGDGDEPQEGAGEAQRPVDALRPVPTIDTVSALERERDEMREIALRLQADFENYRKRVTSQHTEDVNRATGKMAEALLPVLDACEAAFLNHPAEVEPLFNVLLGTLRKEGLEAMNLQDQAFDPAFAEAVIHEPADDAQEPTVTEVLRSGYTWKGRVLRPAMVKVRG